MDGKPLYMSERMDDEEREACALLEDGDPGHFDHPFDTLALVDPVECAAARDEDSNGSTPARLSRSPIPRKRRFWHARAAGMSHYDFFTMFRCRKTTFWKLTERLYGTTDDLEGPGGRVFCPFEHVAIFLFRVSSSHDALTTAMILNVPEDWVTTVTMQVARLVVEKLKRRYVSWPGAEEQAELVAEWEEKTDMRNVIGEIGATHVRVPKPPCDVRKQYTNFNDFFTTILIGIVDARGSFLWFESGAPGSLRDDSVLKKTSFYRRIQAEQQQKKKKKKKKNAAVDTNTPKGKGKGKGKKESGDAGKGKDNGKDKKKSAPPPPTGEEPTLLALPGACVLGDSAFVERPWLRTPIPDPRTRAEHYFNCRHASLREGARDAALEEFPGGARSFGRLKWLFRSVDDLKFSLERGSIIVDACVVLYNYFLAHEGDSERDNQGSYRFADGVPTKKSGYGGRAQWERERESDPPSARKAEMDYLVDAGFLRRDWGKEGSKRARMFWP